MNPENASDEDSPDEEDERVFDAIWRCLRPDSSPPPLKEVLADPSGTTKTLLKSSRGVEHKRDDVRAETPTTAPEMADGVPLKSLGRYKVEKWLGRGGFADVLLCWDELLHKQVAVKVSHPDRLPIKADPDGYLAEARALGRLDHPAVVPVFDAGRTADDWCYVVFKYYSGGNLQAAWKDRRWDYRSVAEAVKRIAEALAHAHRNHLVHRDVKPSNILLDEDGRVHLADFGLARNLLEGRVERFLAGTPAYLSPEQARGEGHRVDPRSDVFSLGVVFYEGLTHQRLFSGGRATEVIEKVASFQPQSLRLIDPDIPPVLDRVCCKALAPRAADRYPTASELAVDLRNWLEDGISLADTLSIGQAIVPAVATSLPSKGLRPFGAADAARFLDLVPGPRSADGLPDIIARWKSLLEGAHEVGEEPLAVGVLYGPSGAGKSSLLKAGLLPRLASEVQPIVVECAASGVEASLLRGLGRVHGSDGENSDFAARLAGIRGEGGDARPARVVLFLDQFERWLAGWDGAATADLVRGLRQCDGRKVTALLIVRDDFWTATTRFLRALEVPLVEDRNATAVEPFTPAHARFVLAAFGRAQGVLGNDASGATFVEQAVAEMTTDGRVLPAQLAFFADRTRETPWTPKRLKDRGGVKGVFHEFLTEAFGAGAPKPLRRHRAAARAVLKTLLPLEGEQAESLVGPAAPIAALAAAAEYDVGSADFSELLHLLDERFRLITRVQNEPADGGAQSTFYVLAHDFLVRPVRKWVDAEQGRTWRGRLDRKLDRLAADWGARAETRLLPAWWEWIPLELAYQRTRGNKTNRLRTNLMTAARRHYAVRVGFGAALLTIGAWFGYSYYQTFRARALVDALGTATSSAAPDLARRLQPWLGLAQPWLEEIAQRPLPPGATLLDRQQRENAWLALLWTNPERAAPKIADRLSEADAAQIALLAPILKPYGEHFLVGCWDAVATADMPAARRVRLACALAQIDPENQRWAAVADAVVRGLVQDDERRAYEWIPLLAPVRNSVEKAFEKVFSNERVLSTGAVAALALAQHWKEDPARLIAWLWKADAAQTPPLLAAMQAHRGLVTSALEEALQPSPPQTKRPQRIELARRRANAASALVALARPEAVDRIFLDLADPTARTRLAKDLPRNGTSPSFLLRDMTSFDRLPAPVRFGRLLCLGFYNPSTFSEPIRLDLLHRLFEIYRNDPHCGVHSVCAWLLERLGESGTTDVMDDELERLGVRKGFGWYVGPDRQTMAILGPIEKAALGAIDAADHEAWRPRCEVAIRRRFAIATKMTSLAQFRKFIPKHNGKRDYTPTDRHPVSKLTLGQTFGYCEFVSGRAGVSPHERAYPNLAFGKGRDLDLGPGLYARTGYRIPSDDEWEYACHALSETGWSSGDDPDALDGFAVYNSNFTGSSRRPIEIAPNFFGFHDMMGNVGVATVREFPPPNARGETIDTIIRQNTFFHTPDLIAPARRLRSNVTLVDYAEDYLGIRLARTMSPDARP